MSYSMMLRYSFDLGEDADLVDQAIAKVLAEGKRTADIAEAGSTKVSTSQMGDAILDALDRLGR
jgi:3-isopropylmalate dehydrogenase